jgi:hypothetical protein
LEAEKASEIRSVLPPFFKGGAKCLQAQSEERKGEGEEREGKVLRDVKYRSAMHNIGA